MSQEGGRDSQRARPLLTPRRDLARPVQYLQLKKKLEDEFPGCLDIVSVGNGEEHQRWSPVCPLSPGRPWGGSGRPSPSPLFSHFLGVRVSPRGHLSPAPPTSLSLQCGEGTPQATGFFEVMVGGKLVHSKKVCLSVRPTHLCSGWLRVGIWVPADSFPLLPTAPERRWLRGHGEQVSEAGGRHQSRLGAGLMCPEGRGEGAGLLHSGTDARGLQLTASSNPRPGPCPVYIPE